MRLLQINVNSSIYSSFEVYSEPQTIDFQFVFFLNILLNATGGLSRNQNVFFNTCIVGLPRSSLLGIKHYFFYLLYYFDMIHPEIFPGKIDFFHVNVFDDCSIFFYFSVDGRVTYYIYTIC